MPSDRPFLRDWHRCRECGLPKMEETTSRLHENAYGNITQEEGPPFKATATTDNPMLATIIRFVIEALDGMTYEERHEFFDTLASTYCMECHNPQPESGRCSCWNDE